jgi:crossover junction endodeoxyribonuclease RuvC
MRILGIDPGTATLGYGLIEHNPQGDFTTLTYGVISPARSKHLPDRLLEIYVRLQELIRRWNPDQAAVELLYFGRNARTAIAVGEARGVTLLALSAAGIPLAEYTPMQVKQAVADTGTAPKRRVQEMVQLILHLEQPPSPDDAADALAIALCHAWHMTTRTVL